MAALANKLVDGHETPSSSIDLGAVSVLTGELLPFLRYLCGGPLAGFHSLSYLLIFRGEFLTAAHPLAPLHHGPGVIAHHALGQLAIGKDIFVDIFICLLYGESGEYTLELTVIAVRAVWRGHRGVVSV